MWKQRSNILQRTTVALTKSLSTSNHHQKNPILASRHVKSLTTTFARGYSSSEKEYTSNYLFFVFSAVTCTALTLSNNPTNCSSPSPTKPTTTSSSKPWKVYTRAEVERHNTMENRVWVTYLDGVFDITHFLANHPGGKEKLMSAAGKDIGSLWNVFAFHQKSPLALELLEEMKIGILPTKEIIHPPKLQHKPQHPTDKLYDVIIIGSGLSGLQCGWSLMNEHKVAGKNILVLEAQEYIGGRVRQMTEFVKGAKIDVGAEFLHGNNTELTKFARANNQPLREIFCWAHGDGGPLPEAVDHGYGLYYVGKSDLNAQNNYRLKKPYKDSPAEQKLNNKNRLLRYDDKDPDFVALNKALWDLANLNEKDFDEKLSLYDYLLGKKLNTNMLKMGEGGFSNTLCGNSEEISLKQAIKWSRIWHAEEVGEDEEDGDYTFKNSFGCLLDHLKKDLQVELSSPVTKIDYPLEGDEIITITTKQGVRYQTKNVVVTASPHVIQNKLIEFHPPLPEEIEEAYSWVKMNIITKVILKFKSPVWPRNLHGMIMTDDKFLLPEIWFRNVEDEVAPDEPATAYAVGFATAKYAERVNAMHQEEVLESCVKQLEEVFQHLEPRHMSEDPNDPKNVEALKKLPKPSEAFLGGMFWDWRPVHHPYIGGGYCSPLVGKPITIGDVLKKGNGKHMFFAGEASNDRPGATAHAALETGIRAANQVALALATKK